MDSTRRRLAYMKADPRVALTILDADGWGAHISFRGKIADFYDDEGLRDIDRMANHYVGHEYPDRNRPRVTAILDVETWSIWDPAQKLGPT